MNDFTVGSFIYFTEDGERASQEEVRNRYNILTAKLQNKFLKRILSGHIGEEHAIFHQELWNTIQYTIEKRDWIPIKMRNHPMYGLFVQDITTRCMMKITNWATNPDPDERDFRIPGVINLPSIGYYVVKNVAELKKWKQLKQQKIDGFQYGLDTRFTAASGYLTGKEEGV